MTAISSSPRVVHLTEDDGTRVMLCDNENNFMPRTVTELIKACRMLDKSGEAAQQFHDLLDYLSKWLSERLDVIKSASIAIRNDGLLFLVVQKQVGFDESLSGALTDLDIAIAQDERFNILTLNVLALPACGREDVEQFFDKSSVDYQDAQ